MLNKSKLRGLAVAGVSLIVMVVVFVAVYDWGTDGIVSTSNVPVRVAKQSPPAPTEVPAPIEIHRASTSGEAGDELEPGDGDHSAVTEPEMTEPPREVTYDEAEQAYHERRYREAVTLFTRYTEQKNSNPWGYYMLGLSAWKAGDPETAEAAFERALELDARHVKSRLNLSRVLLDTHRPQEALTRIDEALLLDPESNDAYRLKARAYRQLGQTNDALEAYRHAIRIDNEDAWSMNNLALIRIEAGQFDLALPPLARAVELDGENPVFLNNLGMALEGAGHFRASEAAYRSAVEVDGSYYKATMNLSRIEEVLEDPDLEPMDLEVAARNFVDEITRWEQAVIASEQMGTLDQGPQTLPTSAPDSTGQADGRSP